MRALLTLTTLLAAVAARADFDLLVADTPFGSNPSTQWHGILRYGIGATVTSKSGIDASLVSDPAGLALAAGGGLFVGNRHGNSGAASISSFSYDVATDSYVPSATFTGLDLTGVHGVNFSTSGEMFAANVSGGVSRIEPAGPTLNGKLGAGTTRDVLISGDGKRGFVTEGVSGSLLEYDLATGALSATHALPGASGLHFGTWRDSDSLFVADYGSGNVYDVEFDAMGAFVSATAVANASTAISVAFSPDGAEMFVAGHTSGVISRYTQVAGVWTLGGTIATGINMGDLQVVNAVPEPATLAALGLGLAALARRRRR